MLEASERLHWPHWVRQILRLLPIRSQFVLSGNIRDVFLVPVGGRYVLMNMLDCLQSALATRGIELAAVYDKMDGLRVYPGSVRAAERVAHLLGDGWNASHLPLEFDQLRLQIQTIVNSREIHGAFVINHASRLVVRPPDMSQEELEFFGGCAKLAEIVTPLDSPSGRSLFNPVFWLFDQEHDVPSCFMAASERIYSQDVPKPDFEDRIAAVQLLANTFPDYSETAPEHDELITSFAAQTNGFSLQALHDISRIATDQEMPFASISEAVRCYQVSVIDGSGTSHRAGRIDVTAEERIDGPVPISDFSLSGAESGDLVRHRPKDCGSHAERTIQATRGNAARAGNCAPRARANLTWPWGTMSLLHTLCVGRNPDFSPLAALFAEDLHMSRRHAELGLADGHLYVRDLGSKCGTYVNDRRIPPHERTFVSDTATIRFGTTTTVTLHLENGV